LLSRIVDVALCKYFEGEKMGRSVAREGEIFSLCCKSRKNYNKTNSKFPQQSQNLGGAMAHFLRPGCTIGESSTSYTVCQHVYNFCVK